MLRTNTIRTALLAFAALTVALIATILLPDPANADILKVTNKRDDVPGSLRAAIENAAPRGDTITFAPNVRGTIILTEGDIDIYKNLTIRGPGAGNLAVSGNNEDGVFYIPNGKTVQMSGLTITKGNSSVYGGGIDNIGNLTLTNSVVNNSFAGSSGGGIYNRNVLTLIGSIVSGNFADSYGGGIYTDGTLIAERSTISGNRAADGGGIYSTTSFDFGPTKTTINNSTISGNSVSSASGEGGGVKNYRGLTEIRNSTIKENTAPVGGSVFSQDSQYRSTRIFSSVIVDNPGGFQPSLATVVSEGYNLIDSGRSDVKSTFSKPGDTSGVGSNHGLAALADNGGPTKTHALQSGSPAINTGSPSVCPAADQRSAKRPHGGRCDIGAFEFGATPPSSGGGDNGGGNDDGGGGSGACTVTGTNRGETLRGTSGRDVICGVGGNDKIYGLGGNDIIKSGPGNDAVYGGAGNDRMIAGPGRDRLLGGEGVDLLNVRDKKPGDLANGGPGKDRCAKDRGDRAVSCP